MILLKICEYVCTGFGEKENQFDYLVEDRRAMIQQIEKFTSEYNNPIIAKYIDLNTLSLIDGKINCEDVFIPIK